MQSEQVFGLVRSWTCTKTFRPNPTARYSTCVNDLFLIRAVAAHTISDSTTCRHEKLSGIVQAWPEWMPAPKGVSWGNKLGRAATAARITEFSKIQLVVYYRRCVLIG